MQIVRWVATPDAVCLPPACLLAYLPTFLYDLSLQLEGEVYVHWHTGSGKDRHDYHKRVPLFEEQVVTVFGAAKGDSSQPAHHLEPQQHYEWAFSLTLPGSLPPSISLREGTHVQYRLTGFLDIPNWPDSSVAHNLDVAGAPLIASEPPAEMRSPVDRRDVTPVYACCCCLRKGDAVLSVSLQPNSLLAFDEARGTTGPINLTAGIHNSSTRVREGAKEEAADVLRMARGGLAWPLCKGEACDLPVDE